MQDLWIFQVDWVFWDTIIIVLLIVFLISVKLFKYTHRWRNSLSNTSLVQREIKNFKIHLSINETLRLTYFIIESTTLIVTDQNGKSSYILIILKKRKTKLFPFAEALASIGIKVIFVEFKKIKKIKNGRLIKKKISEELINKISKAICIHSVNVENLPNYTNIILIFPDIARLFLKTHELTNFFNKYFLLLGNFSENFEFLIKFLDQEIFKKNKLNFIIPLKKFLKKNKTSLNQIKTLKDNYKLNEKNLLFLERSFKSLKNYETIIIGFILKNILKN